MNNISITNIPIDEAEFTVLDVETTGTSARYCKVIEIGLVKVKNGKVRDTWSTLINPGSTIPYHITGITGISTSDVINSPTFDFLTEDIKNFIGDSIVVAHNLPFDKSFMEQEFMSAGEEFPQYPSLCTLKLARKLYPEIKSKSLSSLVKHFRLRHKDVHRALGDATVTAKLLLRMLQDLQDNHNLSDMGEVLGFISGPASSSNKGFLMIKKKLAEGYERLPDKPGVYFFKDRKDEVIYIGKAKSLKKRVKNYFQSTAPSKTKKIVKAANDLSFQETNSELVALIAEAELIKKINPPFNTMLKKFSQNYFIKIDLTHSFPTIKSTGIFDFDGNDYFGPYNKHDTSKFLIETANKTFKIRECKDKDFAKSKVCYLANIERCTAPCENRETVEYSAELEKVYEFLSGKNQNAVNRLLERMKRFAAELKFEEAGEIRDTVNMLLNQLDRSSVLAEPINLANVLIDVRGFRQNDYILLIEGKVFIRDYFVNEENLFETALEDYYSGTINLFPGMEKKDLEQTKIILAWIVKNRERIKIYYLKDYDTPAELQAEVRFRR